MDARQRAFGVALVSAAFVLVATTRGAGTILFYDNFATPGSKLNLGLWTTEIGPSSYLGRTQLADWVTPGGIGQFVVGPQGAQLALNTFNPTGFSLYGTHGKTLQAFLPSAGSAITLKVNLQLTSLQPGLVYGVYFYGCVQGLDCNFHHNEIDIELVTNLLQPGAPLKVQLNRYADEPLGAGNGVLVDLPSGFAPLAAHEWTIVWSSARIDYLLDGQPLFSTTSHVPHGPMEANVIAWGPDANWPTAFSTSLQPVGSAAQNQRFYALVSALTVSEGQLVDGGVLGEAGDFDGTGTADILWRNSVSGLVYLWLLDGLTLVGQGPVGSAPADWVVEGVGDVNGDGQTDVVWRNSVSGLVWIWLLDGLTLVGQGPVGSAPADWVIQAVGDVNGDDQTDIVWRNSVSGLVWIWFLDGLTLVGQGPVGSASGDWVIQGVGDVNGAGQADIVWRNRASGLVWIWLLDGLTLVGQGPVGSASGDWVIQGVGDVNGDGQTDIVWRNRASGLVWIWFLDGLTLIGQGPLVAPTADWMIQGIGDVNGDGKADIVWRNRTSGLVYVWLLDGLARIGEGPLSAPTADWVIQ